MHTHVSKYKNNKIKLKFKKKDFLTKIHTIDIWSQVIPGSPSAPHSPVTTTKKRLHTLPNAPGGGGESKIITSHFENHCSRETAIGKGQRKNPSTLEQEGILRSLIRHQRLSNFTMYQPPWEFIKCRFLGLAPDPSIQSSMESASITTNILGPRIQTCGPQNENALTKVTLANNPDSKTNPALSHNKGGWSKEGVFLPLSSSRA
jgi:hypothetical protein